MEIYKMIRNFTLAASLAVLPYVCDSCSYSGNVANASEPARAETTAKISHLETKLK